MIRPAACLIDIYETLLSCDFSRHSLDMPALAGVAPDDWRAGISRVGPLFNVGRLTKTEGFSQILQEYGVEPRTGLVRALVEADRELLLASAHLYDDSIPFLENLRSHGVKTAIVSNCSEHTRDLLIKLGVPELVDAVILSCEVGAAKPSAQIFRHALDQLGVPAGAALFVDDQAAFCAGAVALGISAAQIVRGEVGPVDGATGPTGRCRRRVPRWSGRCRKSRPCSGRKHGQGSSQVRISRCCTSGKTSATVTKSPSTCSTVSPW